MGALVYQWIDLIWLPVAVFVVHERHRIKIGIFILINVLTFRMQLELMDSIGYGESGILGLLNSDLYIRGLVTYSILYMIVLALAYFSPRTKEIVFFAAVLSIYIIMFAITSVIFCL